MKVRQQKIASFYLENGDNKAALTYIEKNAPLLKGHLILFSHALSKELEERCKAWELCFKVVAGCELNKKTFATALKETSSAAEGETKHAVTKKRQIFRNIRSGESVIHGGDLLIHGNVNDGASISAAGTLTIFGIIEGDINCDGEFLILSVYKRGKICFQGEYINEQIIGNKLKMFYKEDDRVRIKELH